MLNLFAYAVQNYQAALNFSSEDEALKFKRAVDGKLQERSKKRQGMHFMFDLCVCIYDRTIYYTL